MYDNDDFDPNISVELRGLLETQQEAARKLDNACNDLDLVERDHRENPCSYTLRQRLAATRNMRDAAATLEEITIEVEEAWMFEFRWQWLE